MRLKTRESSRAGRGSPRVHHQWEAAQYNNGYSKAPNHDEDVIDLHALSGQVQGPACG